MHKAGADADDLGGGETAGNTERQPLFAMPRMPQGQSFQLGLSTPMWETLNGGPLRAPAPCTGWHTAVLTAAPHQGTFSGMLRACSLVVRD